ncbi:spindle assembly checkpoint kinase [Desmophyllum pertusum]|uniref:Spindle assembly checkpoint kinase n=1 Tax=Desmophyllum pertusum TaxID=174260 RepID=A0A9X0CXM3_9CNID|nr:spindle assembly checkpoint kinase [Desmophyllum pertusum]
MEAVTTNESSPFRWRENNLAERRRMRNDRKKRKRLQRTKCKEDEALNAVSVRIQKEAIQKDRFLALARKYYLKWRQVNEAHKKLQSKANNLSMSSRFGTNPRDIRREADVMARCSHPSIPHIFGVNLTQKPYFLVSYFYGINNCTKSCTLYHALRSPTITLTKYCAGKIMLELCQALQHLHLKQLLHRDIKSGQYSADNSAYWIPSHAH